VLVLGTVATIALWPTTPWLGFVVAFVVGHFFLFCNVFRIARSLELCWSGIFVVLTYGTIAWEMPSWPVAIAGTLLTTAVVIGIEMRKPTYHGILWQRINPQLPQWWAENSGSAS
jgi:hypothetical protein